MRFGPSPIYIVPSVVIGLVVTFIDVAFFMKGIGWGVIFSALFLIPLLFIIFYINYRFIEIYDDALCVEGIFGSRCFPWDQIESVEVKRVGMRNVLWIQTDSDVQLVPIIFKDIEVLRRAISDRLGDKCKGDRWERSSVDLILLYMAALFLLFVVFSKLAFH